MYEGNSIPRFVYACISKFQWRVPDTYLHWLAGMSEILLLIGKCRQTLISSKPVTAKAISARCQRGNRYAGPKVFVFLLHNSPQIDGICAMIRIPPEKRL